ncbi:MAG: glycosyltransferase [Actinomycetes bacterium]
MRILVWHVHGSWTTAFVSGSHTYLLPTLPERGAWGGGRSTSWDWPASAVEVPADQLATTDVDVVILQRPEELELAERWLGRRLGREIPAIYVEHNTPKGDVPSTRHPLADRSDIPIAHVTWFNAAMWDNGRAPVTVIEHGIPDPGARWTGNDVRVACSINEPIRRTRVAGTDLLPRFAEIAPVDVYGIGTAGLGEHLGLPPDRLGEFDVQQDELYRQLAEHRVYLHPYRWTSLGLSLLEAMHLGMPVVVLGTTEAYEAVPPEAGVCTTKVPDLLDAVRTYCKDHDAARDAGRAAREAVLRRYGLARFLSDWDRLLLEVTR